MMARAHTGRAANGDRHKSLSNTAMPKSSDNVVQGANSRKGGNSPGYGPKSPSYRGALDDGSGRGFGVSRTTGHPAKPEAGPVPGREKGSRTVNARTGVPTSIQDVGDSYMSGLSAQDQKAINTGSLDDGSGRGFGAKRP